MMIRRNSLNNANAYVRKRRGEDGYYVASVVELPGCHAQARELNELDERVKEAIALYL